MVQLANPAAAGATVAAAPVGPTAGRWSLRTAESPTKLRLAMAGTVLLAVVLSLAGWWSVGRRSSQIDAAAAAAQQLITVQDVRVQVVQADAIASNAYLVGGEESTAQRTQYDDRIAAASAGLVKVSAGAVGSDAAALQQAGSSLATYVGLVEQARANNRQGFPVGAAYQRQARSVDEQLVASLRQVESDARHRVDESIASAHRVGWVLGTAAVLALLAIVLGGLWLATKFRRLVNLPLALAGLMTLAVVVGGIGANASSVSRADDVVTGSLSAADLLAQARAAGFDARSNEALTLIFRGNGSEYEVAWQRSTSLVLAALAAACTGHGQGCPTATSYGTYQQAHTQIRALDDGGNWDAAVALTTTGSSDAATAGTADPVAQFDTFASGVGTVVTAQSAAAATGFDDATSSLALLRVLVLVAGIVVAVLSVVGYGQRLREYR